MKLSDFALSHADQSGGEFSFFDNDRNRFKPAFSEGWSLPDSALNLSWDVYSLGLIFCYVNIFILYRIFL